MSSVDLDLGLIEERLPSGFVDGISVRRDERVRGVLAGRNVARGERILSEAPFLLVHSSRRGIWEASEDGSLETLILGRLRESSCEDQDRFWSLDDCRFGNSSMSACAIDCRLDACAKTAAGIFLTNQMEVNNIAGGDELVGEFSDETADDGLERSKTHHALFLLGCLFNHSCTPNVYWSERAAQGEIVFHTLREIEEGEELTIAYAQVLLALPFHHRQEILSHWKLRCACVSCRANDDLRNISDERRTLLNLKMQLLGSKDVYELSHNTDIENSKIELARDPVRGIALVREICELVDDELSGHAPTKAWAYLEGFAIAEGAGRKDTFKRLDNIAVEMLQRGYAENCIAEGCDSPTSQALRALLQQYVTVSGSHITTLDSAPTRDDNSLKQSSNRGKSKPRRKSRAR
eukprot:TRINITY_DN22922_c0_g1_i1.p1 TRINITY_DN22922_c0_g1~~TRINITY_DN22922_c0_g1_i1.p1  ORF type:complete len:407 (-),score=31.63 TRINITY_DN22922_c0_g1_i1:3-1223(-)